ncbi:hypothetical protein RvY_15116 [Ramazzottius varieornatus]|uniref:Uncharacterized protein n=1 Tax=Ramazzottius varieornatus TaxID=947166 RepID=A0A1D1W0Q7_RAMVA|nr:hypothetical protein RvY_15116 [Ramazzottius varieornatus]
MAEKNKPVAHCAFRIASYGIFTFYIAESLTNLINQTLRKDEYPDVFKSGFRDGHPCETPLVKVLENPKTALDQMTRQYDRGDVGNAVRPFADHETGKMTGELFAEWGVGGGSCGREGLHSYFSRFGKEISSLLGSPAWWMSYKEKMLRGRT